MSSLLYLFVLLSFAHIHGAIIEDLYESGGNDLIEHFVGQSKTFEDGMSLKIKLREEDDHGNKLIRMQQFYMGIRVYDSHIVFNDLSAIDDNEDTNRFVTGTFVHELGSDLSETELDNKKLEMRKNHVLSHFLESEQCDDKQVADEVSETVIFVDEKSTKAQIGFIVGIQCLIKGKISLPTALMNDAGKTVSKWDRIMHYRAKAQGPGGNDEIGRHYYKSLNVSKSGQSCFLATDEIVVVNNNFSTSLDKKDPWKFNCPNQTTMFIHGGYCPMNDAFTFGNKLVAMFKKFYNTNPLPAKPMILHLHFGKYQAAGFYPDINHTSFGDGDGVTSYPFASGVSVIGHELGHGILHKHLTTCPKHEECGCLNEAFGDITGTTLRRFHYNRPIKVWQIGNEVMKIEPGTPIGLPRCLDNPHCNGPDYIDNCDDYEFAMEEHKCSGVLSKAYYLMAIQMPRDVYDAYDIIYCSLSKLWDERMTFAKAAMYSLMATDKLNESNGKWCLARQGRPAHYNVKIVQNAFRKVGIKCKKGKRWFCNCKG